MAKGFGPFSRKSAISSWPTTEDHPHPHSSAPGTLDTCFRNVPRRHQTPWFSRIKAEGTRDRDSWQRWPGRSSVEGLCRRADGRNSPLGARLRHQPFEPAGGQLHSWGRR
jgi:hypothetical protein